MVENKAPKIPHLMREVQECVENGRYLDTRHSLDRQAERAISRLEVLYVLRHGYHEKRKDRYEKGFTAWNYAVRGKTLDRKELRVIVSFDKDRLLIITAIAL